jgi:hypothetical protein
MAPTHETLFLTFDGADLQEPSAGTWMTVSFTLARTVGVGPLDGHVGIWGQGNRLPIRGLMPGDSTSQYFFAIAPAAGESVPMILGWWDHDHPNMVGDMLWPNLQTVFAITVR